MWQTQARRCSFRDSINALEADIHHANTLVAALPRDIVGDPMQMKLSFAPFAPFFLCVLEWMDCSCFDTFMSCFDLYHVLIYRVHFDGMPIASPEERRATLQEFYGVIYPMVMELEGNLVGIMDESLKGRQGQGSELEREEDECGICMEMECKVVLPNCGHTICISCFEEWHVRSRSCPFCRGSLKRVSPGDLWVLTSNYDVVDNATLARENLRRFYLYVEKLPLLASDESLLMYNYLM